MIDAITAAVDLMTQDFARMNAIAQNLANVSTPGFKREVSVARPFASFLMVNGANGAAQVVPVTVPSASVVQDMRAGTLRTTGNPLDVAIQGAGFFEVRGQEGARYTRHGGFRLDASGRLVTESGLPVMGTSGELFLSAGQPVIDRDGRITEGDKQIGQLRVVRFADPRTLVSIGGGMYVPGEQTVVQPDSTAEVRQGHIEASNVTSMTEMVRMIETMRRFETGQKVIQAHDDMLGTALNRLGQF